MIQSNFSPSGTSADFATMAHPAGRFSFHGRGERGATAQAEPAELTTARQACLRGIGYALAMQAGVVGVVALLVHTLAHR